MFQVVKVSTQSYHVVNTAIPGGERVEHHSTEEAATQAALRLSCGAPEALEALPLSGASEELEEVLQGRAGYCAPSDTGPPLLSGGVARNGRGYWID